MAAGVGCRPTSAVMPLLGATGGGLQGGRGGDGTGLGGGGIGGKIRLKTSGGSGGGGEPTGGGDGSGGYGARALGVGGGGGLASKRGIDGGVRRRLASRTAATLVLGNRANARSLASSGVVQSL